MGTATMAIFRTELKLLFRNMTVAVSATVLPLGIAVFLALDLFGSANGPLGWALPVALQLLMVFGMTAYFTSAAAVCYRRDDLYLKRLRCAEASDSTVLAGVLSPVVAMTLVQSLLMLAITGVVGPAVPANPVLLLLVIVGGTAMCVSLGVATSGLASTGEQAQTLILPFFFLLLGSAFWASMDAAEGLSAVQLLLPGGAVLELARLSYDGSGTFTQQLTDGMPALGVLVLWVVLGLVTAKRYFRWEPRS